MRQFQQGPLVHILRPFPDVDLGFALGGFRAFANMRANWGGCAGNGRHDPDGVARTLLSILSIARRSAAAVNLSTSVRSRENYLVGFDKSRENLRNCYASSVGRQQSGLGVVEGGSQ